jgi:protein-disulfide isomerase
MRRHIPLGIAIIGALCLAAASFFAGFFVGWDKQQYGVSGQAAPAAAQTPQATSLPDTASDQAAPSFADLVPGSHPARGPIDAVVTIIEFSDFQCSYCKRYVDQTLPLILATYGDRVRYVFRDFPLGDLHPQAFQAAEAAQCANEQGKFWEYHDILFQNQEALDIPSLKAFAARLDLDQAAFDACLDSGKYGQAIQDDLAEAAQHGIDGTPTFLINGRVLVGAKPFATFQKMIDEELAKAEGNSSSE